MTQWEESKHPRDEDGKFTSGGGTPAEHKRLKKLGSASSENKNSSLLEKLKKEEIENFKNKLSYNEKAAIQQYFSSESYKINEKLNTGKSISQEDKNFIKTFDSALKKLPFVKGKTLTRDMWADDKKSLISFFHVKKDEVIKNDSYWSTTRSNSYQDNPTVRIIFRKASKARDMSALETKGEAEAIYERGNSFKVLSKKKLINDDKSDRILLEVEEL